MAHKNILILSLLTFYFLKPSEHSSFRRVSHVLMKIEEEEQSRKKIGEQCAFIRKEFDHIFSSMADYRPKPLMFECGGIPEREMQKLREKSENDFRRVIKRNEKNMLPTFGNAGMIPHHMTPLGLPVSFVCQWHDDVQRAALLQLGEQRMQNQPAVRMQLIHEQTIQFEQRKVERNQCKKPFYKKNNNRADRQKHAQLNMCIHQSRKHNHGSRCNNRRNQ